MPELPEVESMRLALLPYRHIQIKTVTVVTPKLREVINPSFVSDVSGSYINTIKRFGKYLVFYLNNKKFLVMHAGMSGKYIIERPGDSFVSSITKHNHIIFVLQNDIKINFNDPRRFGLALTFDDEQKVLCKLNLGIDALSKEVTPEYLHARLKNSTTDIKTFLLNQKILAGIGNIYASEILFHCKIHPLTKANTLSSKQVHEMIRYTKLVLKTAIHLGGSTLKDYQKPNGESGGFQHSFAVYHRENHPCPSCGTMIKKITIKGRSTFYCPEEQVLPISTKNNQHIKK